MADHGTRARGNNHLLRLIERGPQAELLATVLTGGLILAAAAKSSVAARRNNHPGTPVPRGWFPSFVFETAPENCLRVFRFQG